MKLTKKSRKKKGFTLIELIVVVSIMLILSSFMVPKVLGYQEKAKKAKVVNTARQIFDATMNDYAEEEGILTQSKVLDLINLATDVGSVSANVVVGSDKTTATVDFSSDSKTYNVVITTNENKFVVNQVTGSVATKIYSNK